MDETTLQGSYYDIGRQYADVLEDVGFSPPPASDDKLDFAAASEPSVEAHVPDLLEELTGLAEGGGWDVDLIKAIPLALTLESGCSVVALSGDRTEDGSPLFGRNYDFYRSFAPFSELFTTRPENQYASVGCADHWTGRHDGINEAGLAIGHTFVPNHGEEPGIMFSIAARAVLDTCESVTEAVDFLEGIPHARNTNFVVVDATGDIATVEASPELVVTTRSDDGFAAATNHFLSDEMRRYEDSDDVSEHSIDRLHNMRAWAGSSDALSLADLQCVLSSPTEGACSCASADESDPVETLWSWTARLDPLERHLCRGRPDTRPYRAIQG